MKFPQSIREGEVREHIRVLCERGNITVHEYQNLRGNSWEWHRIQKRLDDDALVYATKHALEQLPYEKFPYPSYDVAVTHQFAPLLVERFEAVLAENRALRCALIAVEPILAAEVLAALDPVNQVAPSPKDSP